MGNATQGTRIALLGVPLLLSLGCSALVRPPALPDRHSVVRDQLVIYSNLQLPAHHRLLDELAAQRSDVSSTLGLPVSDEPIYIYLFGSAARFEEYIRTHYPDFPQRRAFFVETDTRLLVFAHWGDRVAEDLRHEVAHGYLHATVQNLPLWIDEGLAEYFEVPRGNQGLNPAHMEDLLTFGRGGTWHPNLSRLEAKTSVADLTRQDYAEGWAWVHFLLAVHPELLQSHLQAYRQHGAAPLLSASLRQIYADPDQTLFEHIGRLAPQQTSR